MEYPCVDMILYKTMRRMFPLYILSPWFLKDMPAMSFIGNPHFFESDVCVLNRDRFSARCWTRMSSMRNSSGFIRENIHHIMESFERDRLQQFMRNIAVLPDIVYIMRCYNIISTDFINNLCLNEHPSVISLFENMETLSHSMLTHLCYNRSAIHIIERHRDRLDTGHWFILCQNENAVHLFDDATMRKIQPLGMYLLCRNPAAVNLVSRYIHRFNDRCWHNLCRNPNPAAIDIIRNNLDKTDTKCWTLLSRIKTHEHARFIFEHAPNIDNVCWHGICLNPHAVPLIETQDLDNMGVETLASLCLNPRAIHLIEQQLIRLNKACWRNLCKNADAIHIIRSNIDKIDTHDLWAELCH